MEVKLLGYFDNHTTRKTVNTIPQLVINRYGSRTKLRFLSNISEEQVGRNQITIPDIPQGTRGLENRGI